MKELSPTTTEAGGNPILFTTKVLFWLILQESGDNRLIHLSSKSQFIKVSKVGTQCQGVIFARNSPTHNNKSLAVSTARTH